MNTNMHLGQLVRHALLAAPLLAVLALVPLPAATQAPAARPAGQYAVGDRPAAPAPGKGAFREIGWDDLIPADWNPEGFLSSLELDKLEDKDPRAAEALQRMREEWDRAPLVEHMAGARVRIPGFVVPLETSGEKIREFLLVPYFGACVHVPPPPANQLIHVIPDKPVPGGWNMLPVWVTGVMAVGRIDSDIGTAGYQLRAVKVEEYVEEKPTRR
ncbi:MAG: DUF3299 domain-containing protein [Thauera sp.]|nr:DUF3299 domain-containing protein [Thauera sp.]